MSAPHLFRETTKDIKPTLVMEDPIIDRSPYQKRLRIEKLRTELKDLGYSVIATRYLAGLMVQAGRITPRKRRGAKVEALEAAE